MRIVRDCSARRDNDQLQHFVRIHARRSTANWLKG
jgi:hypothetical protein